MLVFITRPFSGLGSTSAIATINHSPVTVIIVYSLLVAPRSETHTADALLKSQLEDLTASADVARRMWTSPGGAVENKLSRMRIEQRTPMAESCVETCSFGERQMTGDRRSRVYGKEEGVRAREIVR